MSSVSCVGRQILATLLIVNYLKDKEKSKDDTPFQALCKSSTGVTAELLSASHTPAPHVLCPLAAGTRTLTGQRCSQSWVHPTPHVALTNILRLHV